MIGNVRWNLALGAFGFALTFLLSVGNNFILRTLLNSVYSFLILFTVAFALRWVLGTLAGLNRLNEAEEAAGAADAELGRSVDAVTPEDQEQLNELLKEQLASPGADGDFMPLQPKKFATVPDKDSEELAQALRRLTEE